jgi:Bardet-Biedl syndrome 2 protein
MLPAFRLNLGNPINHGQVVVGKYDGKRPSLTCATSAGKVFLHSPHNREEDYENDVRFLNINHKVTALAAGAHDPSLGRDVLLVGTQTNLLAYDVEKNSDIFYVDVPDGVNRMLFGRVGAVDANLAIVGGNCSIQGFGHDGTEQFWTVTGDNVTAMAFCDVDEDGQNELLVGSEDFEIRVFSNEEVVSETTETDKVTGLCPLRGTVYGYALGNGTIGVYDKSSRVWRVKSKNKVTAIAGFDLDGDGMPELISGWSNGKLEVRNDHNGEVVYKDYLSAPVSGIVVRAALRLPPPAPRPASAMLHAVLRGQCILGRQQGLQSSPPLLPPVAHLSLFHSCSLFTLRVHAAVRAGGRLPAGRAGGDHLRGARR